MPTDPPFPAPLGIIEFASVPPGDVQIAAGGLELGHGGPTAATAEIAGDDAGVFSLVALETLALVREPDAPPGTPRVWDTVAQADPPGPIGLHPAVLATVRFACPAHNPQDSYHATVVFTPTDPAQSGASLPVTAAVRPPDISLRVIAGPDAIFAGDTQELTVRLSSTFEVDRPVFVTVTPVSGFETSPTPASLNVPANGSADVSRPLKCLAGTPVGRYDGAVTVTMLTADDPPLTHNTRFDITVLERRSVTVTSSLPPQLTLLHPSLTPGQLQITVTGGPATVTLSHQTTANVTVSLPGDVAVDGSATVDFTIAVDDRTDEFDLDPKPVTLSWFVPGDEFHPGGPWTGSVTSEVTLPPRWIRRDIPHDLSALSATGRASVLLQQDGLGSFRGHVHNSGLVGLNFLFAAAFLDVTDAAGNVLTFVHTGEVDGTVVIGSPQRDADWQDDGPDDPAIRQLARSRWDAVQRSRVEYRLHASVEALPVLETVLLTLFAGVAAGGFAVFVVSAAKAISCQFPAAVGDDGIGVVCSGSFLHRQRPLAARAGQSCLIAEARLQSVLARSWA